MSKKLLINNADTNQDQEQVDNKYTGTKTSYPIVINSEYLDEEEKTFVEEIYGNTVQNESNLSDIQSAGDLQSDGTYEIEVVQCNCPVNFGKGGEL